MHLQTEVIFVCPFDVVSFHIKTSPIHPPDLDLLTVTILAKCDIFMVVASIFCDEKESGV